MRRFTVQLSDEEFEHLVALAVRDDRPVAVMAARLIRHGLGRSRRALAAQEPGPDEAPTGARAEPVLELVE